MQAVNIVYMEHMGIAYHILSIECPQSSHIAHVDLYQFHIHYYILNYIDMNIILKCQNVTSIHNYCPIRGISELPSVAASSAPRNWTLWRLRWPGGSIWIHLPLWCHGWQWLKSPLFLGGGFMNGQSLINDTWISMVHFPARHVWLPEGNIYVETEHCSWVKLVLVEIIFSTCSLAMLKCLKVMFNQIQFDIPRSSGHSVHVNHALIFILSQSLNYFEPPTAGIWTSNHRLNLAQRDLLIGILHHQRLEFHCAINQSKNRWTIKTQ